MRLRAAAVVLAFGCGACAPESEEQRLPERGSRYGILADLVFHPRPARLGGAFFLDRFETTRGDWDRYLTETERSLSVFAAFDHWNEPPDEVLPVVGVDQRDARAYARWRFGRLPRLAEWEWAASAGGSYRLPWGDVERAAWANTQELAYARLTPVGAFESGRSPIGCYDLVGNAAEWTGTPFPGWLLPEGGVAHAAAWFARAPDAVWRLNTLRSHPALAPWGRLGQIEPLAWLWAVDSAACPVAVIAGFTQPLAGVIAGDARLRARPDQIGRRLPGERSSELGVRVASDPATLIARLASVAAPPTPSEWRALRRFLSRSVVREALAEALAREPSLAAGDGPIAVFLRAELGR